MKMKIIAMLLATVAGTSFAAGGNDADDYQKAKAESAKDFKEAIAKCKDMSGNDKVICTEQARADRARADADAIAKYKSSKSERTKARVAAVEADYGLARARCAAMTGTDKDDCVTTARKDHALAIADARADRPSSTAMGSSRAGTTAAGRDVDDVRDQQAMERCAQVTGDAKSACLIDKGSNPTATEARADAARAIDRTENATERAARRTDDVAENAAERTEDAAERAADNTRRASANVAQETREAAVTAKEKTKEVASNVADKTERATERAGEATADAAITTKVKSKLLAEQNLKSLGIHVETENGVVMLSGFVNSKQEAQQAVTVAKGVKGVNKVESAIKVK